MGSVGHLTNVEENEHHFTGFDVEILLFYFLAFAVSTYFNLVLLCGCFSDLPSKEQERTCLTVVNTLSSSFSLSHHGLS